LVIPPNLLFTIGYLRTTLFGVYLLIRKRAVLRYIFAYWRFMLACWQTCGYFDTFANNVNKKMTEKALFLATELDTD